MVAVCGELEESGFDVWCQVWSWRTERELSRWLDVSTIWQYQTQERYGVYEMDDTTTA